MSESVKVSNPISIKDDSPYRVAYDLMSDITHGESLDVKQNYREYLLTLYSQCLKVVYSHADVKDVLG